MTLLLLRIWLTLIPLPAFATHCTVQSENSTRYARCLLSPTKKVINSLLILSFCILQNCCHYLVRWNTYFCSGGCLIYQKKGRGLKKGEWELCQDPNFVCGIKSDHLLVQKVFIKVALSQEFFWQFFFVNTLLQGPWVSYMILNSRLK